MSIFCAPKTKAEEEAAAAKKKAEEQKVILVVKPSPNSSCLDLRSKYNSSESYDYSPDK